MKIIVFCCLLYIINVYATCNKQIGCKQTIYSFEGSYKAYPDKDSIRVGDTIWVELTTPTQLKDITTNQTIDYGGAENFGPSIQYFEFTGGDIQNPGGVPAANNFENALMAGTAIQSDKPDQVRAFKCKEESGNYKFLVGITPKKKGIFAIAASSATGVYRKNDECTKAKFNLAFKDTDQHLYLYEQNRPGYNISEGERAHTYCFKVYL